MLEASFKKETYQFKIPAGTSRGILKQRPTWFLKVWDSECPYVFGIGECAPLVNLSIDDRPDFEDKLNEVCKHIESYSELKRDDLLDFPAIRFGLEMAFNDLKSGGKRLFFGQVHEPEIPINGLIWMGDESFMKSQIDQKLEEGWGCIKMKIGAIDFEKELKLLSYIREQNSKVQLRVDANGAFDKSNVYQKLEALAKYDLHSIEQPIKQGQWDLMREVCDLSPIPVGMDEELIGVYGEKKIALLDAINPQYLVMKPTLLGGFDLSNEWIQFAEERNVKWWITSSLEAGEGLSALRQYVSEKNLTEFQGLGTGTLFR
jgi:L-alanine-DL-glutamate epimerase-like enolase superfamily enzyme